jgi:membrane protease YdiL (CAAX protease family)
MESAMHTLALIWVVFILALMPLQAILSRRKVQNLRPTRMRAYASTISGLTLLGAVTLGVDWFSGGTGIHAAGLLLPLRILSIWTLITLLCCATVWLAGMLQRKLWQQPADEVVTLLLPRTTRERWVFAAVSILAGMVEEYVMRGFCLLVLAQATGSMPLSLTLVTVGFAVAHGYQGVSATVRTGVLGAILAVPVVVTSTLIPSMVAHAGTDLLAGALGFRLLRRWNLLREDKSR